MAMSDVDFRRANSKELEQAMKNKATKAGHAGKTMQLDPAEFAAFRKEREIGSVEGASQQAAADLASQKLQTESVRAQAQAQRELDQSGEATVKRGFETGLAKGKEIIGDGSLGRIDENSIRQGRSAEITDIIAQRKKIAEEGLGREEVQAERSKAAEEINRQSETQRRRLQAIQASQGLRGGTASAQQSELLFESMRARGEFERDVFLKSEQVKREALGALESSVTGAEADEASRKASKIQLQQFNLQQASKEKFGQVSTAFGFAGLAAGDAASQRALEAAQSQSTSVSGGK